MGSGASMLCPPAKGMPARRQASRPPAMTCPASAPSSLLMGQPRMATAIMGWPPMAYTSLMAFTAAICPKAKASSTMGMKKSVVLMMPVPSPRSKTAASSLLSCPTSRPGKLPAAPELCRICSSTAGAILQPQPAPWLYWVRRTGSVSVRSGHGGKGRCWRMLDDS